MTNEQKQYTESNYFALCFLMPEQKFLKAIKENTSEDGKMLTLTKLPNILT